MKFIFEIEFNSETFCKNNGKRGEQFVIEALNRENIPTVKRRLDLEKKQNDKVNNHDKQKINISWVYRGDIQGYYIRMNDEEIYFTKDARDRDLFIAELKLKIFSQG